MKKTLFLFAVLALTVLAISSTADGPVVERNVELKIVADDEVIDLQLADLEVGDTQQFFTESGKEVVVSRGEDGYDIDVEGRDEPIHVSTGTHAYAYAHNHDCGDDCQQHVVVKKHISIATDGDSEGHQMVFMSDDGELHELGQTTATWVGEDGGEGGFHVIRIGGEMAAARLLESGVLDDLSEAKRQEILEALEGEGDGDGNVEVKVLRKHHLHEE